MTGNFPVIFFVLNLKGANDGLELTEQLREQLGRRVGEHHGGEEKRESVVQRAEPWLEREAIAVVRLALPLPDRMGPDTYTDTEPRAPGLPIIVPTDLGDWPAVLEAVLGDPDRLQGTDESAASCR